MKIYARTENRTRANITQHATHANGTGPLCGCGVGMDDHVREGELSDVHCKRCLRVLERDVEVQKPKVLIVDDDSHLRKILAGILKRVGYDVKEAEDGLEALELLIANPDFVPVAVLSDHDMPRMTGFELHHQLLLAFPTLGPRLVLMSGNDRVKQRADDLGLPFLSKPFSTEDLQKAIKSALP